MASSASGSAQAGGASVTEGKATIYFPKEKGVFYNPPQIPNRDLSVLALREFAQRWQTEMAAKEAKAQARRAAHEASRDDRVAAAATAATAAAAGGPAHDAAAADESEPAPDAEAAPDAPSGSTSAAGPRRIRVLDAMTASGLRALRYVLEIPEVESVVANDLDPTALAALKENVKRNGLTEEVVIPSLGDAVAVMHRSKPPECPRFEAVEIDPYGTAAPFLDSAVQCVAEGGLLMVTCTDLAVLCASYPEKCYANYGAWPHKAKSCHEAALRIVLACIESHANRHKRYIEPLLCVHINFYVRLFVRVYTGPGEVKKAPTKLANVYQCTGCDTFALQPLARLVEKNGNSKVLPGQGPPVGRECEHCGRVHHVGGPLWSAPIHDHDFVTALLTSLKAGEGAQMSSAKRLIGMLTSVIEEIPDAPLFYQLSHQCGVLHVPVPQMVGVVSALMRQGYRVSRSHTDAGAIKTDAPAKALWDVLRSWANSQGQGVGQDRSKELSPTSPAYAILSQAPAIVADFRPLKEAVQLLSKRDEDGVKLGRWMPNPEEWGPGSKATSHASFDAGAGGDEGGGGGGGGGGGAPVASGGAAPAMLAKRARLQGKRGSKNKRQARDQDGAEAEGGGEEEGGEEGGGEDSGSPKN